MSKPLPKFEIEGRWEEIAHRAPELAGRRVRITVLPERSGAELKERAEQFVRRVRALEPSPIPSSGTRGGEYAEQLAAKYRKQGLDV